MKPSDQQANHDLGDRAATDVDHQAAPSPAPPRGIRRLGRLVDRTVDDPCHGTAPINANAFVMYTLPNWRRREVRPAGCTLVPVPATSTHRGGGAAAPPAMSCCVLRVPFTLFSDPDLPFSTRGSVLRQAGTITS